MLCRDGSARASAKLLIELRLRNDKARPAGQAGHEIVRGRGAQSGSGAIALRFEVLLAGRRDEVVDLP